MLTLSIIYAFLTSTIYILLYINTYERYFELRKHYLIGLILFLISIYAQFIISYLVDINIGFIALLSFITYPISISLIYKTNIFNVIFLSLNAIIKIYIMFLFFSVLYASSLNVNYEPYWIKGTIYFNLSQGHAYLLSIGSLYLADVLLLKNKLKDFFQLKRNLVLLIMIQLILIINTSWLSFTNLVIDYRWYNSMLLITSFSFEIIYFLLRLFTARSSYFSSYKVHSETLEKQLRNQIEHYKTYEEQMEGFLRFRHDYEKILNAISNLLELKEYETIEGILVDHKKELDLLVQYHKKYSNNIIVDALLNDYAKRFNRINTKFSAETFINLKHIPDLKLIKLFYNVLENSYEAILKVESTNRVIDIRSELVKEYIKISFINSTILTELPTKTTKLDNKNHGFGIGIINEIINEYDGFSNTFITSNNNLNYYHFEIFLPIN